MRRWHGGADDLTAGALSRPSRQGSRSTHAIRTEVPNILDVAESSVHEWQRKFREGGLAALFTKIASGRKRLLTDEQLKLYKWPPGNLRQVQFDFGQWTRKMARSSSAGNSGSTTRCRTSARLLRCSVSPPSGRSARHWHAILKNGGYGWRMPSRPSSNAQTGRGEDLLPQMRRHAVLTITAAGSWAPSGRLP